MFTGMKAGHKTVKSKHKAQLLFAVFSLRSTNCFVETPGVAFHTEFFPGRQFRTLTISFLICRASWKQTPVAAKSLKKLTTDRERNLALADFQVEATILQNLRHPNIW